MGTTGAAGASANNAQIENQLKELTQRVSMQEKEHLELKIKNKMANFMSENFISARDLNLVKDRVTALETQVKDHDLFAD